MLGRARGTGKASQKISIQPWENRMSLQTYGVLLTKICCLPYGMGNWLHGLLLIGVNFCKHNAKPVVGVFQKRAKKNIRMFSCIFRKLCPTREPIIPLRVHGKGCHLYVGENVQILDRCLSNVHPHWLQTGEEREVMKAK